jgi:hypothetical protein
VNPLHRRSFFQTVAAAGIVPTSANAPQGKVPVLPPHPGPEIRRGPYLQAQGPDRIVIRWRIDGLAEKCRVRFGDDPDSLTKAMPARLLSTPFEGVHDWEATIDGLEPGHRYYYAIESSTAILAGADEAHQFRTAPERGKAAPVRFWVLGDCGTNRIDTGAPGKSVAARNGFRKFNRGQRDLDGIILLGDNAYSHGTDAQYQTALFSVYQDELRNLPLWPCIGNHELTDDYLSIFTVPENGELGGVPSGSVKHYSFDYANIHFVVLDLWKTEWRTPDAPQLAWLERDLATTRQDWLVVINHFPPYCDGKYESDSNGFLVEVREKIMPILDRAGVDLLLTGHDHTYQRSYLIDGHYGPRSTFQPARHLKAQGDGTTEPLHKSHGPHSGMITIVTGTAGAEQGLDPSRPATTGLGHPAMVKLNRGDQEGRGARKLGTFLLEVDGLTLTGTQVDAHAEIVDRFTLRKQR